MSGKTLPWYTLAKFELMDTAVLRYLPSLIIFTKGIPIKRRNSKNFILIKIETIVLLACLFVCSLACWHAHLFASLLEKYWFSWQYFFFLNDYSLIYRCCNLLQYSSGNVIFILRHSTLLMLYWWSTSLFIKS